jgi:hypothetical protein
MNPKFDFYSKLLLLCRNSEIFIRTLAQDIVEIYEANKNQISLTDVTFENLELWHGQMADCHGGEDPGIEKAEEIAICAFDDLASQMRSEAVRSLHREWKEEAGISDDLFVHVRRSKDLGDGAAAITVVTDDIRSFRSFFEDPDEYVRMYGEVHFSTAKEVLDPV